MSRTCSICGGSVRALYSGSIRSGNAGAGALIDADVLQCEVCELAFLSQNPHPADFYETEEYRKAYLSATYDRYLELHLSEQTEKLSLFDPRSIVGKRVCDVGSGPGVFLSLKAVELAGFRLDRLGYYQVYDLSNLTLWLRDGKPTGLRRVDFFPESLDAAYRSSLEASGLADHLVIEFSI